MFHYLLMFHGTQKLWRAVLLTLFRFNRSGLSLRSLVEVHYHILLKITILALKIRSNYLDSEEYLALEIVLGTKLSSCKT